MPEAEPVAKPDPQAATEKPLREPGFQPMRKSAEPVDSQRVSSPGATKLNSRLQSGTYRGYIPEAEQAGDNEVSENVKSKEKQASVEVAARNTESSRRSGERKGVVGYLSESEATDLAAIAAAQNSSLTRYVSKLLAAHVSANPELAEQGRPIVEAGKRVPYRTRRQELEEEVGRLRAQIGSVNPN